LRRGPIPEELLPLTIQALDINVDKPPPLTFFLLSRREEWNFPVVWFCPAPFPSFLPLNSGLFFNVGGTVRVKIAETKYSLDG